tara:strand:- start:4235 stop:5200 length:966 start_codon:yes stop_codon:yes gene_type:complete
MRPVVIAHRGASAYLPEHTVPAKVLAYAMGADYLEQDVVASRDDELVVLHDIYLDRVSNVAEAFPDRHRDDGRYYVRDFDLAELLELRVWERFDAEGAPVYPGRYPGRTGNFRLHSLRTELELVRHLNTSTEARTGIYPEIKRPAWHRAQGIDIAPLLLELLEEFDYRNNSDPVYVQCFDANEVVRLRRELGCPLKLVQLIGENEWAESETDYAFLQTDAGLQQIAAVADGIGPRLEHCMRVSGAQVRASGLVERAHKLALAVHPYTVRADSLPDGFSSHDALVTFCVAELKVDGLFSDFPDETRRQILALEPASRPAAPQ